ncbi:UDP-glycosyltransferase 87A1-like [Cynara cardunculus var. scolymus]|uniref:UDP-glucuronosyl/UDP-glucosyltransferase n=1 Tax=Cynara cardunculus var. scolymus TaxID=59895 RepID=A0A103Y790_CYNCS|nr:UDP-glycosyltransferase 87A1-like [Cynara cardunculus var. scolymus]KVI03801.1 hypothetical protein Ccrd_017889 [Cynara cardunculus var. scolymus]
MNQVVMVPFPGRGHINPMLNLCNLLSSRVNEPNRTTVFTVVLTEEWLGLINPDLKQANVRFATIPNVLPSELHRGSNMIAFLTAVCTKMELPFEEVLDQMEIPVELIIADAHMYWPFDVANKRNIPVTAYWPLSASMFSVIHHADLLESHHHLGVDVSERGKECIDYIPGVSAFTVADIPEILHVGILKDITSDLLVVTQKANSLLLSTIYDLESDAIDVLKSRLKIPIFTAGPNIPLSSQINSINPQPIYINWLDSKPPRTVLYVSFGSFLPISDVELEEIVAGLRSSGVSFLWVARGKTADLKEMCGEEGMVVEWCDQMAVLLHSSIGGFWTHCGWNSVKEGLFSGVPMLTLPIFLDQPLNEKAIVEDWKVGRKARTEMGGFKRRDEIAEVVRRFMDSESVERIGMMERAEKLREICRDSVGDGGSANEDLGAFIRDIVTIRK